MSLDRLLARVLAFGQRLAGAWTHTDEDDDGPWSNLRSLLREGVGSPDTLCDLYKAARGPYSVDCHWQSYRDRRQGREVPVAVQFPLTAPPAQGFPVVIVSPGLGAHPQATRYLEQHLASHGYLVLCPVHQGSDWSAVFRRSPLGAFSRGELLARISEIHLALSLLEEQRLPEHLLAKGDPERVALVGHSFGALTIQALAGVPVLGPQGDELPLSDPRFRAFVCMSPYGEAFPAQRLGMKASGYAQIDRPILFMSGDRDDLWTVGRGPHAHLWPYRWVATEERYHLLIGDTRHSDFSEIFGYIKAHTATMVNSTTVAFLDAYLREEEAARRYLREDFALAAYRHRCWAFSGTPGGGSANGRPD